MVGMCGLLAEIKKCGVIYLFPIHLHFMLLDSVQMNLYHSCCGQFFADSKSINAKDTADLVLHSILAALKRLK